MKQKLKILLSFLVVALFLLLGNEIYKMLEHKKQVEENIKKMPAFTYLSIKEKKFTNNDLYLNKATVFFYYNSECDYCNHEAQMVKENLEKFKEHQLVFVSFEKVQEVMNFANKYQLNNLDNVTFVSDTNLSFETTFDVKTIPAIVVYDKNNKLITKLKGQTKPEKILELLL